MKRFKLLTIPLLLSAFLLPTLVLAQEKDEDPILYDTGSEYETISAPDYNYDSDYDYNVDWELDYNYQDLFLDAINGEDTSLEAFTMQTILVAMGIWLFFIGAIGLVLYVFTSFALMRIGQKLGYQSSWFAWIPILNIVMLFQLGEQNPWLLLLILIPGIGAIAVAIISVIAYMRISEKLGFDKLLGLLVLVPTIGNLVLLGILAWKDNTSTQVPTAQA